MKNKVIYISLIFIALSILTINVTYAKYDTETTQNDKARVATFGKISITEYDIDSTTILTSDSKISITPGIDVNKKILINYGLPDNNPETAAYIFIKVHTLNWDLNNNYNFIISNDSNELLSFNINNDWNYLETNSTNSFKDVIYYKLINPCESLVDNHLIDNDKIIVSNEVSSSNFENIKNSELEFYAYAVQAGEFTDVKSAWDSVK